jgi:hypothetical protein
VNARRRRTDRLPSPLFRLFMYGFALGVLAKLFGWALL